MLATVLIRCLPSTLFVLALASSALAQTQYQIGNPTNEQQYMLELINRARANGEAEAARLQGSDNPPFSGGLQEGPPTIANEPWTINNVNQPLSWNVQLFNAANAHATNLNNGDQFFSGQNPHTFGGPNPQQRIAAAGYPDGFQTQYNGPTTQSGFVPGPENIATQVTSGGGGGSNPFTGAKLIAGVLKAHNDLFTDTTVPGRGHRSTTMLAFWREIGIGISTGTDNGNGTTWQSLYIVQNFGTQTSNTPFITGVVYNDANGNGFYDPGEGIGGVRVDVAGSSFFAISTASGGYSVPVPGNGSYTITFSGGGQPTRQVNATIAGNLNSKVDYNVAGAATPPKLVNVATRLPVGTGDNALIGGFIVTGTQNKTVVIRAIGPSLTVAGKLVNPTLQLFAGQTLLAENNDWKTRPDGSSQQAEIAATGVAPTNDLESAIVFDLPASPSGIGYTAVVRGVNNGTGIAVVEVYDLNPSADSTLANISTRGVVQTGDNALFAGTFVLGQGTQRVALRAIGPSLTIAGKMENPTLELRNAQGTPLAFNDNWKMRPDGSSQQAEIAATGVAPTSDFESAIVFDLPASASGTSYTAIVRGAGDTTGIAVVEMYALD
jgi:uncharacterized protein YkwD